MKRTLLASAALLSSSALYAAPGLTLYGGGYTWDSELEGTFSSGGANIDVQDDLGFTEADQSVIYLGIEHAVPVIPNFRVRYMDLSDTASNRIQRSFEFNGETYTAQTRVDTDFDLEMLDGTFYYTPVDTALKLDVGLTVRRMEGYLHLNSLNADARIDIDEIVPMLHVGARANLPVPGVYVGGEINAIEYDSSGLSDFNARVGWRSDYLLGIEVGYSHLQLDLEDVSKLDTNLEMGGPYLALSIGF
ncbi:MAG: TIGR04219 family outer membrane beta-barrel protein [Pseudomonadota bacterium]|nr:TIGR04219 family outer membrane beta-barrel protein [Pseudomonadota bacterium]